MKYELKKHCYVLPQLIKGPYHPIAENQHDFLWYPERAMTLYQQVMYRPHVQSIVTESPWLIGCYPSERVRVWEPCINEWVEPPMQTYCGDHSQILYRLLGIPHSTPASPLDGCESMQKVIDKLTEERRAG